MSSINIAGDTSGSISLTVPSVAGSNTVTIPASSGSVMVSGNQPAFSAYPSSALTVSNATATKVLFQTEEFDTNNNFASSRFTPTVAGYYQVNAVVFISQATQSDTTIWVYKNGSAYKRGFGLSATTTKQQMPVNCLVYLNGSTDYIEIYVYSDGTGSATVDASATTTWFQSCLVRNA
jgi:hypothetical protein